MLKLVIINPHTIQWCISGIGQVLFPLLREVKHELKKGLQQFQQIFPSKCVARSTGLQATCDNKSILKAESGDICRVWGGTKLPFVTKELQITLANTAKLQKQQLFFFKLPSSLILGKTSKTCCEMLWGQGVTRAHTLESQVHTGTILPHFFHPESPAHTDWSHVRTQPFSRVTRAHRLESQVHTGTILHHFFDPESPAHTSHGIGWGGVGWGWWHSFALAHVFKALRNGLLRYILHTCPNL